MNITKKQFNDIALCLKELADEAEVQRGITQRSILGTNSVITIFTVLGSIIVLSIFYYFFAFNRGVSHSVESMGKIQEQMVDLRNSMDSITFSIDEIGQNVGYVDLMSTNINTMARSTDGITKSIYTIGQQTHLLGENTKWIRYNASVIDQHFGRLNYSISNVSSALNDAARPVERFFPFP